MKRQSNQSKAPVDSVRQKGIAAFNQIEIRDQVGLRWVVQKSVSEQGTRFLVTVRGGGVRLTVAVPIWIRSFSRIEVSGEGGKAGKVLSPAKWGAVRPGQELSIDSEDGVVLFDAATYAPPGTFPKPPPPPPKSEPAQLVSQPSENGLGVSFLLGAP